MAETGNERGGPKHGQNRGADVGPPPFAPTDAEWATDDFSSLDLGEDAVDTSSRPVRRLDLPPLMQTDGPSPAGRPDEPSVFASVPDDENLTVSSSAAADRPSLHPVQGDQPPPAQFSGGPGAPKQGAPPHPLTATRATDVVGNGPAPRPPAGLAAPGLAGPPPTAEVGDFTAVYDARGNFGPGPGPDRRQAPPMGVPGGSAPGGPVGPDPREMGRPSLELAPAMAVQQDRPRWMIPVAALLGILALAAGYFLFVQGDDDSATFAAESDDLAADLVEDDLEADPADPADDTTDSSTADPAAPAALSDSPVLTLQGAADGPLEVETKYEMTIDGVPAGSQYLVVVDDIPQEPALDYLPVLILPEGRHTISVTVTSGAQTADTNAVDVYVLAPELTATYRANLSSVNIAEQGWAEAMKQFDEFRAAGHENLLLSPSDPYPSLLPGFWNLYVAGFADAAEATAYCEQFELAIPEECFPAPFDPDGPPRDG